MQMSENDQFDGSRVDAFARQTVLQPVVESGIRLGVALRCARAGTRPGIDDDRLASAAQQPRNTRRVQARGTAVLAVQKTRALMVDDIAAADRYDGECHV
ncbi:hypothetical protein PQR57_28330 [Paraburkholderia dipogonis]|uniref:Uncharacterized protein n=1 Tax=Paraburkholderia dipogonis TaxID=1211383 RepID=A0ABW9AWI0_9BURK